MIPSRIVVTTVIRIEMVRFFFIITSLSSSHSAKRSDEESAFLCLVTTDLSTSRVGSQTNRPATLRMTSGRRSQWYASCHPHPCDQHVDQLNSKKRHDNSAKAVHPQIAA